MGFSSSMMPWGELERRLSDGEVSRKRSAQPQDRPRGANGGDSPAWSRRREPYQPPSSPPSPAPAAPVAPAGPAGPAGEVTRPRTNSNAAHRYAELHVHSAFSFLDGASTPEALVEEAVRRDLEALALTDHDGLYGIVRFAEAARAWGLPTVFGAELTLDLTRRQPGQPDPPEAHLVVLARSPQGYARLARAISHAHLAGGEKGQPRIGMAELGELAEGQWCVLTGCRKGRVPAQLVADGPRAARRELDQLVATFGREHVRVELWDHGDPLDSHRNDALAQLATHAGVDLVVSNNVHYATPARRRLATAMAAVRSRRSLDEVDGWLPASAAAHIRSGAEQHRRFSRFPGAVAAAAELAAQCAFDLALVAPKLPDFPIPPGHTEMSYLRELVAAGARRRYGSPDAERVHGAYQRLAHELDVIEALGFPGYFLVVWDIVEFCRRSDILCQGRGSAATSAVCYVLGITNADAVSLGLLFERFLSPGRDGPPDIDVDIESGRREEVIQYVYQRYGRQNAAQVANVITYRARSAVRDIGKAFGFAQGQVDAWSKQLDGWTPLPDQRGEGIPPHVLDLAREIEDLPRHLGIHSGGMVICDRPVVEVCPVEWGRMPGRTVLQWDKDDCAAVGLVKFDLLGLGMLSAIHGCLDLVAGFHGDHIDLATLPQEEAIYDQLCEGDSVGVFQVESRAQIATLPRLRPRHFYDLVVEVALIRPGPIQGGSVHPYLRRRNGTEAVTYLHPLLEPALAKTLGVPLFQEQLMQIAIDVAGFSAGEADQLRQAMGSKRSAARMERLRARFFTGMAERGIEGAIADAIWDKLAAFANFGFPESHSVSFAYLVYSSAWLRHHYAAAFTASLLNAQPMGFWSPHSLVNDAARHGVVTHRPDLNRSTAGASLESDPTSARGAAIRLGLESVRHISSDTAQLIVSERVARGDYVSPEDLVRRTGVSQVQVEALATANAFDSLGLSRRAALWAAGAVAQAGNDRLNGIVVGARAPQLPSMAEPEQAVADLWSTGVAPEGHPTLFLRDELTRRGITVASALVGLADRSRVAVAGVVTHRQRPATAGGVTFISLEDETGLMNVVVSKGAWARYRQVVQRAGALVIHGRLERTGIVVNIVAQRIDDLPLVLPIGSRDFR